LLFDFCFNNFVRLSDLFSIIHYCIENAKLVRQILSTLSERKLWQQRWTFSFTFRHFFKNDFVSW